MNYLKFIFVKTDYDKPLWFIWYLLVILLFSGVILMLIANHTQIKDIVLTENQKTDITLFSFTAHNAEMRLFFKAKGKDRPELGNFNPNTGSYKIGTLEFKNPGEPIQILLSDSKQKIIYEAMPASGYGNDSIQRGFAVFLQDNNPSLFSFGKSAKRFSIKPGFSTFQMTILNVGDKLKNEKVLLCIDPPLGFKHINPHPLYRFLWFFFFWPFYVLILFIFYIIIIIRKIIHLHKHPEL